MINWHHSPANLYKKHRRLGLGCMRAAEKVMWYYDSDQGTVMDFLMQIDPDGYKQYMEYQEMCEALKDKYTEMGIL